MWKYIVLDYVFLWFHTLLIVLNLFGWIFVKTRKLQRVALVLTLFSWLVLGLVYGWGYCVLTDWHWNVLAELDRVPSQSVYVAYLLERLLHIQISRETSDVITVIGLLFGITGCFWAIWWERKRVRE
jgi:hypothetical protein